MLQRKNNYKKNQQTPKNKTKTKQNQEKPQ